MANFFRWWQPLSRAILGKREAAAGDSFLKVLKRAPGARRISATIA